MNTRGGALPCCIDFEASGLYPESYPIESGWSLPDGTVKSMLISPASVPHWTHWDFNAEYATHQFSRARLIEVGHDPREVAEAMNADLKGLTVYSDNVGNDEFWCDVLFEAAGIERQFTFGDYWSLLHSLGVRDETRRARLIEIAQTFVPGPYHRAGSDVRLMLAVVKGAMGAKLPRSPD